MFELIFMHLIQEIVTELREVVLSSLNLPFEDYHCQKFSKYRVVSYVSVLNVELNSIS